MTQEIHFVWVGIVPRIFFLALFLIAVIRYAMRKREQLPALFRFITYKRLIWSAIFFKIIFAGVLTTLQYLIWKGGGLGRLFLHEGLSSTLPIPLVHLFPWIFKSTFGYFIFYSLQRFWLNVFLALFISWLFYRFLILLKTYKERFFDEGEVELGYLMALIVGWPFFILFVPIGFLFVVVISVFRLLFFKEAYTTLGWPFIWATLLTLLFGSVLLPLFGLTVFSI